MDKKSLIFLILFFSGCANSKLIRYDCYQTAIPTELWCHTEPIGTIETISCKKLEGTDPNNLSCWK